ncbi:MAG: hypothetical protein A2086_16740 [Spirochaetes bacterium GWD1_27_9]|nr:MAG: hypothetical protein A2Z98_00595 [Spirochaetes bacterium GWB1_27_13]OHD20937.1 MAG: hypothetical protein A2Y34_11940 [Spirochaetes bacterium GWC1_27_15]OHD31160.1 MAG: hypothetical protein A2086_16740 [Spirochaetes bacterium GWD1_27_9]
MKKAMFFIAVIVILASVFAGCKIYNAADTTMIMSDPAGITDAQKEPNKKYKGYETVDAYNQANLPPVVKIGSGATAITITLIKSNDIWVLGDTKVMKQINKDVSADVSPANSSRASLKMTKEKFEKVIDIATFVVPSTITESDVWAAGKLRFEFCEADPSKVASGDWDALKRLDFVKAKILSTTYPYLVKENADYFQLNFDMSNAANDYRP